MHYITTLSIQQYILEKNINLKHSKQIYKKSNKIAKNTTLVNIYKIHYLDSYYMYYVGARTKLQIRNVCALMFLHIIAPQVHEER